jgi:hypothetical protein
MVAFAATADPPRFGLAFHRVLANHAVEPIKTLDAALAAKSQLKRFWRRQFAATTFVTAEMPQILIEHFRAITRQALPLLCSSLGSNAIGRLARPYLGA